MILLLQTFVSRDFLYFFYLYFFLFIYLFDVAGFQYFQVFLILFFLKCFDAFSDLDDPFSRFFLIYAPHFIFYQQSIFFNAQFFSDILKLDSYNFYQIFLSIFFSVGWVSKIYRLLLCRGERTTNECPGYDTKSWCWDFSSAGALGNVEYPLITIAPWSTLTRIGSTWLGPICGSNRNKMCACAKLNFFRWNCLDI